MAFQRPASAFRNVFGSAGFPFEDGRYTLYVALACPWANGILQIARLKGLVPKLEASSDISTKTDSKLQVAIVHPTWQYTDVETDRKSERQALAAGVSASEPHAGWVFSNANDRILPLAVLKNSKRELALDLDMDAEEFCTRSRKSARKGMSDPALASTKVLEDHGVASAFSTLDPSKHTCKTLRDLYEICGGYMSAGVRATTPMLFDSKGDCIVNNESMDLAKYLNEWGGAVGPDLYPEALRTEIDAKVDWIYAINNGVYRCGFASSQPAYDAAANELEKRMKEVDEFMVGRKFLVGEQLTIADIRLFNTLIRMDEVYVIYFKCYFASLRSGANGSSKFPNLLRFTAHLYNDFPEIRESVCMDDIRNHYFTSHAIRNMFAIVPKEIGVLRELEAMHSKL